MADMLTTDARMEREPMANVTALADHRRTTRRMQRLEGRSRDYLYFIATVGGPIKIGRTCDLDKRLSKIGTACPLEIDWAVGWPGRGDEEKAWHQAFADSHVRGEWFDATEGLLAAIRRGKIAEPPTAADVAENYERLLATKV